MKNCRDEIQRIKAGNPDITHREAFSAAAKNVNQAQFHSWISLFYSDLYFFFFNI